eukprot:COSAG03_NODE_996_length_5069_cov_7.315091_3_plen_78_part_00
MEKICCPCPRNQSPHLRRRPLTRAGKKCLKCKFFLRRGELELNQPLVTEGSILPIRRKGHVARANLINSDATTSTQI